MGESGLESPMAPIPPPPHPSPTPADPWASRLHLRTLVLLVATSLGVWLCIRMGAPFLPAIAGALALAVLFAPMQRRMESRFHPSLAAGLAVLVIALIVVVPALLIGQRLAAEAAHGGQLIATKIDSGEWQRAFAAQPRLQAIVDRLGSAIDIADLVRTATAWLSRLAGSVLRGSVLQLTVALMTFYLLFFFLRDRAQALRAVRALSPLPPAQMDHMFARVNDTIHATVYGTLAVSAVQGLLGGLMFWWLGLPAPLLWGVVMALLAIVPVLGAFLIWVPAAVFLALEGQWVAAIVLTAWGLLVVGTIDNLLRPMLVGNRLKLHTVLAFLSLLGGLVVFGASGLILGPVILTITLELLASWREANTDSEASSATGSHREPESDSDTTPG